MQRAVLQGFLVQEGHEGLGVWFMREWAAKLMTLQPPVI